MLSTLLEYATNTVVVAAVALVCGVVFSQKIKDWFSGVDSATRAAIAGVETKLKTDIAAAKADVIAKLPHLPVVTVAAPAPAAVTAPAPAPAPPAA